MSVFDEVSQAIQETMPVLPSRKDLFIAAALAGLVSRPRGGRSYIEDCNDAIRIANYMVEELERK